MSNAPPCNKDVFRNGQPLFLADTGATGGADIFEKWIVKVRKKSGQPIDWHYSGGVAQVLYLGDRAKLMEAINTSPLPSQVHIMRWCEEGAAGLYRAGVTPTPPGAVAAFYDNGESSFLVDG
jgi:hypothetical protein